MINKIAYLGHDFFASCLEAMLHNGYEVKWLFWAERDKPYEFNEQILKLAQKHHINIIKEHITAYHLELLKDEGCDLVVSAAYPYKIPTPDKAPCIINIHPEMLPRGRGPWPLPWVILNNLQTSAVTIHKVCSEFDQGDILAQLTFPISERENLETLSAKVQMKAPKLLLDVLSNFEEYWQKALPQQSGEYWPWPKDEVRKLDWSLPIATLDKTARAFGKFGSYAKFDNQEWLIEDLTVWAEAHQVVPGTVVNRGHGEITVAAADGFCCLRFFRPNHNFVLKP